MSKGKKHILTEEDLKLNPELEKEGLKVGDEITIPNVEEPKKENKKAGSKPKKDDEEVSKKELNEEKLAKLKEPEEVELNGKFYHKIYNPDEGTTNLELIQK